MKKITSIALTLCMLLSLIPMGIMTVSADPADPSVPPLLLDMKIESEADGTIKISDEGPNGAKTTVSWGGPYTNMTYKPVLGTIPETGKTYATFAEKVQSGDTFVLGSLTRWRAVVFDFGTEREDTYAMKNALTFEMWIKPEDWGIAKSNANPETCNIFAFSGSLIENATFSESAIGMTSTGYPPVFMPNFRVGETTLDISTSGEGAGGTSSIDKVDVSYLNGAWSHVVFTRKWTPDEEGTGGTWLVKMFIDGKEVAGQSYHADSRTDYANYLRGNKTSSDVNYDKLILGSQGHDSGTSFSANSTAFAGHIGDFKMYDGILSDADIAANYNNEKALYGSNLRLHSATPANGALDLNGGSITIDFNEEITDASLAGITLTKDGDAEATNMAVARKVKNDKTNIIVYYGGLDGSANYTLTIPTTTQSTGGATLGRVATYPYTTPAATNTGAVKFDFESFEPSADFTSTTTTNGKFTLTLTAKNDTAALVNRGTIVQDSESGNKYLKLEATNLNDNITLDMKIAAGQAIYGIPRAGVVGSIGDDYLLSANTVNDWKEDEVLVYETKVYSNIQRDSSASLFVPESVNAVAKADDLENLYLDTAKIDIADENGFTDDEKGFSHFRMIFSRSGESGNNTDIFEVVDIDIYDALTGKYIGRAKDENRSNFASYVQVANVTNGNNEGCSDELWLDDINLYRTFLPKVLYSDYNSETKQIELIMSENVDATGITTLPLKDPYGASVANTATVSGKIVTITPSGISEDGNYTVDISGLCTATEKLPFATKSITINDIPGISVTYKSGENVIDSEALQTATSVSAEATIRGFDGDASTCVAFLAIYDGDTLEKVVLAEIGEIAGGTLPITADVNDLTATPTYKRTAKFFIWGGIDSIAPLYPAKSL